jgi:DNA invertase Pin-like site-specific DNA recombinase
MRVSTTEQELGPEAQRRAIEAWSKREAVTIRTWHVEHVSGAARIERKTVLLQAIEDLRAHGAGRLVVAKRDRLAREVVISAMIERLVERCGARISTADGTTDASGPEGALLRSMIDVFGPTKD